MRLRFSNGLPGIRSAGVRIAENSSPGWRVIGRLQQTIFSKKNGAAILGRAQGDFASKPGLESLVI